MCVLEIDLYSLARDSFRAILVSLGVCQSARALRALVRDLLWEPQYVPGMNEC